MEGSLIADSRCEVLRHQQQQSPPHRQVTIVFTGTVAKSMMGTPFNVPRAISSRNGKMPVFAALIRDAASTSPGFISQTGDLTLPYVATTNA